MTIRQKMERELKAKIFEVFACYRIFGKSKDLIASYYVAEGIYRLIHRLFKDVPFLSEYYKEACNEYNSSHIHPINLPDILDAIINYDK